MKAMLRVEGLDVTFGRLHILRGVSLETGEKEIVSLVGGNGAGKTTFIHSLSGLVAVRAGEIIYRGSSIRNLPPHERVSLGLVQVPEGRRIFREMTVRENLEMGGYLIRDSRAYDEGLRTVFSFFPILKERESQKAQTLSGGEQQMLAIGRSLMCRPQMLMLDEPSLGLAPIVVKTIFRIIREINGLGVTILLVEQNVRQALAISRHAYVIENGVIAMEGKSSDLLRDEKIMKTYLGM
jgi:branched-chain amino acid transport system ATP-binding protein